VDCRQWIAVSGFPRAVLSAVPADLAVLPVRDVYWNDLGNPDRVIASWRHSVQRRHPPKIMPRQDSSGESVLRRGTSVVFHVLALSKRWSISPVKNRSQERAKERGEKTHQQPEGKGREI